MEEKAPLKEIILRWDSFCGPTGIFLPYWQKADARSKIAAWFGDDREAQWEAMSGGSGSARNVHGEGHVLSLTLTQK